jgi:iron complex transport system ATP-binding protein
MIEVKELRSGYGKREVIHGASVCFEKGKLISIIGANGCGKSTLLKSIVGVIPIVGGIVSVDGEDACKMPRNSVARRIGYLSQGRSTPQMTVAELVLCGRFPYLSYPKRYKEQDRKIAIAAMERVGISHLADCPLGELSGGMRQNAYLAMALAQETDYILLDEPTTYLDIAHQLELMKILTSLAREGRSVVTVMHDLPMAFEFSDEIVAMSDGRVIAQDTPFSLYGSGIIQECFGVCLGKADERGGYFYRYK